MNSSFKTGAIALAFLVLGFELAMFVHHASVERVVANRDRPDTVYVYSPSADTIIRSRLARKGDPAVVGRKGSHSRAARAMYEKAPGRKVESFRFNPNTVTLEELCRLGFSEKQAQSILNYREKGGRFRRKADFAKSYVVADSVFKRLAPFIDIPKIDINKADSAAFDSLPGIGGWFAHRMVEYREQLRGYSCPEQLMEIWHFDQEKFDGLKDLIICSPAEPYPFWSGTLEDIRNHPHIRNWQTARDIVFYRDHNPSENLTVDGLLQAGILTEEQTERLRRCHLE
ncbi:MAG: helix-hairpin-helix domain-containing protein [Bacteroidales bacterium]|nr:helix-hairpin-helix domain-containing protein [Bacteroidales bacterium]